MKPTTQINLAFAAISGAILHTGKENLTPLWSAFLAAVFIAACGHFIHDCFKP